jgi:hypothetical protein
MKWWRRHPAAAAAPVEGPTFDHEYEIAAEMEKARQADAAVIASRKAKELERARLRDSETLARAIQDHLDANGWTDRIRSSFEVRGKDGLP